MKLRDANLHVYEKKAPFSFMYFAFIFTEDIKITTSEETLKVWEHNLFLEM